MTKTLYLVRHAKTEQESPDGRDFSRELKSRGLRDSTIIGNKLKEEGVNLDMVITSTAARAQATADILATHIGYGNEAIHQNDELYMASVRTFLQIVNQLKNEWNEVMLVGHNPAITYLGEFLTGADLGYMPTGAVVSVEFDIDDWSLVSKSTGKVIMYLTPKMIKEDG